MKNNNENSSNHPEMNEDPIEVSKDVPNTVEELLDMQDIFKIKAEIEEIDDGDLCIEMIEKTEVKNKETINSVFKLLHERKCGPNHDLIVAIALLRRIKGFHKFFIKRIDPKIIDKSKVIKKLGENIDKLEIALKILENDLSIEISFE
mgnify:FL=1|tara:strand:+ start:417 stop:860 length:444 start_codon:yes stop_codon:yes gene_type:complete